MKRRHHLRRPNVVLGVAWFRSDQWELLRSLAADPERLEETHSAWEEIAEKAIKNFTRLHVRVRKVDVDVNELQQWCLDEGRSLDGSARAEYATYKMNCEALIQ